MLIREKEKKINNKRNNMRKIKDEKRKIFIAQIGFECLRKYSFNSDVDQVETMKSLDDICNMPGAFDDVKNESETHKNVDASSFFSKLFSLNVNHTVPPEMSQIGQNINNFSEKLAPHLEEFTSVMSKVEHLVGSVTVNMKKAIYVFGTIYFCFILYKLYW